MASEADGRTTATSRLPQQPRLPQWLRVASAIFGVGWGANQFASLLVAYHQFAHLSAATSDALFGVYALGLVPALLLGGPASDKWGRRRIVRPAAVLSVVASIVLMLGGERLLMLYAGRFLAGVATGAILAAGAAWIKELSGLPYSAETRQHTRAKRAATAASAGFGVGPVASGLIAQWAPHPLVLSYVPHLVVMSAAIVLMWPVDETVTPARGGSEPLLRRVRVRSARQPRFLRVVAPMAPWVFAGPSIAFAVLPAVVATRTHGYSIAFAAVTAGLTLGVSVAVQPAARRLAINNDVGSIACGLLFLVAGSLLAALSVHLDNQWGVLPAAGLLGAGCGLCLVSGLTEVQRLAGTDDLAGMNAVFFALTYVGFAAPLVMAELSSVASYPLLLLATAGLCLLTLAWVMTRRRPAPVLTEFESPPSS